MRVSMNWLSELVEHGLSAQELSDRLTVAGLEVETIENQGYLNPDIVVGKILRIEPIKDKDQVKVIEVEIGDTRTVNVVSGAPNITADSIGELVPVALPGATVFDPYAKPPKPRQVKASKLYGSESEAVLCSKLELGLGQDHDGVWILDGSHLPGDSVSTIAQVTAEAFADTVLSIDILPNIARCMSMNGIALEVASLTDKDFIANFAGVELEFENSDIDPVSADSALCDQFYAGLIEGIEVKPSPQWMQQRLLALGMEPRNNVVDVSNYVMMELGQPTHMYDADQLASLQLGVRPARSDESFKPLVAEADSEPVSIPEGTLVITSADAPVAAAGVMGGYESQVTDSTCRVLLEAAHFDYIAIRKSQGALNLFTDASARFSRGVDPALPGKAARRILYLLKETCPDLKVVQTGIWSTGTPETRSISIGLETLNSALGTHLTGDRIVSLLSRVGLPATVEAGTVTASIDSSRQDMNIPADIMEEVARLNGYDAMPSTMPVEPIPMHPRDARREVRERAIDALVEAGLQEALNYSLSSPELEAACRTDGEAEPTYVKVQNPITRDRIAMRRALMPGLLQNAADNLRHTDGCALFEVGRVFLAKGDGQTQQPDEPYRIGVLLAGVADPSSVHSSRARSFDFHDLSRSVMDLLDALNIKGARLEPSKADPFHPGICAELTIDGVSCGHLGAIHPLVKKNFDLSKPALFGAELNLEPLLQSSLALARVEQLPRFPGIELDLALVVRESCLAQDVLDLAQSHGGELMDTITIFDLYRGNPVPADHKALGLRFSLRAADRTLTMNEANEIRDSLFKRFEEELGATLRSE